MLKLLFQSFIDQLIEDKKSISQKCESLTVRIIENILGPVYPRWPGGDEDGGEEEQGEHQSHGDQAQPGDEQGQTGFIEICQR